MTTTVTTGDGQVCVFVAVDHCTAECVGIHAAKSGNRFEALEPVRQGVREYFGGFDRGIAAGLAIRHDHGDAYMSDDFQAELAFLGMTDSPSFVREPEGNGVAERFIRTLKNVPSRPCTLLTRCRGEYNGRCGRLPLGLVGTRPLVSGPTPLARRIVVMPRRSRAHVPPRA